MDDLNIEIRSLRKNEIPHALELWKETGLDEGNHCINTWYEIDKEGFKIAITDTGEIIGVCLAITNHEDLVHVGMYVVKEKYRGKGIGMKIWNVCLDHIGDRNAVVNAVPGKWEAYRDRGGFPIHEKRWKSIYCHSNNINITSLTAELDGIHIIPITNDLMELVLDYDMNLVQYDRSKALKLTINEADSTSHIAVADGKLLGACAAVSHNDDVAFVGLYAVTKKYRGLGIGVKVWKACIEHIGEGNAAVNAVPGKLELYRDKGGFPVEETEWYSIATETTNVDPTVLLKSIDGVAVDPISKENLPIVLDYDATVVGYRRDKIITLSTEEKDSVSYVAEKDGQCVGYGIYKTGCQDQGLVGPLYADSQDIAEVLLRKLLESLPQAKGFALMIISTNKVACSILEKVGGRIDEECPRLYKKIKMFADINKVIGQLDLNFSPY